MSLEWTKGRGEVNPVQLDEFEHKYEIKFPDTYKYLIEKNNGGSPTKNLFDVSNGREGVFESLINWDPARKANIYFWMDDLDENKIIPFGKDPFGNLICFDFRVSSIPSIIFWDHETGQYHLINNDWDTFISSLKE